MFRVGGPIGLDGRVLDHKDGDVRKTPPPPRAEEPCAICLGALSGLGMPAMAPTRCKQGHYCHSACFMELSRLSGDWTAPSYILQCPLCAAAESQPHQGPNMLVDCVASEFIRALRFTSPGSPARDLVGQQCWLLLQGALSRNPQHPRSLFFLGLLLLNGIGLPQDATRARQVFVKADSLGEPRASVQLARLWRDGEGGPKNKTTAMELLSKADAMGDMVALLELGIMYKTAQDFRQARGLFARAADAGDPLAALELGLLCKDGLGGQADQVLARSLLHRAHLAGFTLATWELACMLKEGIGGDQDATQAHALLQEMKANQRNSDCAKDPEELLDTWLHSTAAKEAFALEMRMLEESGEWWQLGWGPLFRGETRVREETQLWDADEDLSGTRSSSSGSRSAGSDIIASHLQHGDFETNRRPAALRGRASPTWSPTVHKIKDLNGTEGSDTNALITTDGFEAEHPRCCVVS
mmetsp:Transcript_10613/g.24148  ORF Transcript_10613/g.24148 Transcript_10613/m.24148 type:complete len:470 (+) Transcript_10613:150-1559(+)